ncbi:uncharacterized protein G2W53_008262 [Senna tora]|uniref:Uncharacterized protein n=1 Tax=Senna tora TaxID=362788 RepID=A0A834X865_9FABA|nr:uncharacterized protein G2W53_008262 [Senna tora]
MRRWLEINQQNLREGLHLVCYGGKKLSAFDLEFEIYK